MRIMSYRRAHDSRAREHVNQPIDPARVSVLGGDTAIVGLMTAAAEWRVTLTPQDIAMLNAAFEASGSVGQLAPRLPDQRIARHDAAIETLTGLLRRVMACTRPHHELTLLPRNLLNEIGTAIGGRL
jgi:hypothetical protein